MIRTTFVMENHLGHETYYKNLRRFVDEAQQVAASWVEVTYENSGQEWIEWPMVPTQLRGMLYGRAQVQQGLRSAPADVVLFNTQTPAAIGGRIAQKRPYILCTDMTPVQLDRMGTSYNHQADRGPFSWYKHAVIVKLLRGARRLLPWSNWVKTSLIDDYTVDPKRIEVIPPGVDLDRWHPACIHGEDRPARILFVGGDLQRKGGDLLLRSFQALPPGLAELVLVTRTPISPMAGVAIRDDLTPNSPELIRLFQTSDIFAFPTRAEAFGIAAVEASATGLPIVATNVGGLPDIVSHGETGFVVPPDNESALTAALSRLLEDVELRQRFGRCARVRAESRFDARRNAARILAIITETANQ